MEDFNANGKHYRAHKAATVDHGNVYRWRRMDGVE